MLTEKSVNLSSPEEIEGAASSILQNLPPLDRGEGGKILEETTPVSPMTPVDAARFLANRDPEITSAFLERAREIKEEVFEKRIVLFAPLYLSSICHNSCLYCGFRKENMDMKRIHLTPEGATREAKLLAGKGYTRLLLVSGDSHDISPASYITDVMTAIYENTDVRILHLNAAPMNEKELKSIKMAGAGVYQVFQETYHRETYKKMHPAGRKASYSWRITCMDRAQAAGFDDVGIGSLLGLYDWKFEILSTILHGLYLKEQFGSWPHTISVPRLKPARGSAISSPPIKVSDGEFLKAVAAYRLCCPPSGVVISTREEAGLRERAIHAGASQISAGSSTAPGGYTRDSAGDGDGQFSTEDRRDIDEVIEAIIDNSLVPSLCTSCYRSGRTGKAFSDLAASGHMEAVCLANSLLSLAEYAHNSENSRISDRCMELVHRESGKVDPSMKEDFRVKLERTQGGKRDERF